MNDIVRSCGGPVTALRWPISWHGSNSLAGLLIAILLHSAMLRLGVIARVGMFNYQLLDQSGVIVLALLWLISITIMEGYLRSGVKKRRLKVHIARILFIEMIFTGLAYALQWLLS